MLSFFGYQNTSKYILCSAEVESHTGLEQHENSDIYNVWKAYL